MTIWYFSTQKFSSCVACVKYLTSVSDGAARFFTSIFLMYSVNLFQHAFFLLSPVPTMTSGEEIWWFSTNKCVCCREIVCRRGGSWLVLPQNIWLQWSLQMLKRKRKLTQFALRSVSPPRMPPHQLCLCVFSTRLYFSSKLSSSWASNQDFPCKFAALSAALPRLSAPFFHSNLFLFSSFSEGIHQHSCCLTEK